MKERNNKDIPKRNISEFFYGSLPFILLIGIPVIIPIAIKLPKILTLLLKLGNGSYLKGLGKILLGLVGGIGWMNIVYAIYTTIDHLDEKGIKKGWIWLYIILTILGIGAMNLIEILK